MGTNEFRTDEFIYKKKKTNKHVSNLFWNRNLGKSHEEYSGAFNTTAKVPNGIGLLDLCSCDLHLCAFVKSTRP